MQFLPTFDAIARVALAILVNGLWQGALIAFVAWIALYVFRRANASTRYAVWALALFAVMVVPVATSLSRVSVDRPETTSANGTPWHVSSAASHTQPLHGTTTAGTAPAHAARSVTPWKPSASHATPAAARPLHLAVPTIVASVIVGLWLTAAFVVLVRLAVAMLALERLKHNALPLGMDYRDAMPRWEAALKGHRDVRICVSDQIEVPVAIGLFDAMILLPSHLVHSLDPQEIDQISLHELAHLLRSDDWTNGLQRIACALLFFNPAVWFIARQLDIEREVACDDFVLQLTGAVRPYAFCLTKMAEMTAWPHRPLAAPGVFVTRKNISIRIERLLRTGRTIGSSIAPNVAAAVSVALLAIFFVLRTMTPSIAFTENAPAIPAIPAIASMAPRVAAPSPAPAHVALPAALPKPAHIVVRVTVPPIPVPEVSLAPAEYRHWALQHQVAQIVKQSLDQSMKVAQNVVPPSHGEHHNDCVGCDYAHANLPDKDFSNHDMEGTNFAHANLQGSHFDHAQLTGVNFDGADLRNVSFAGANLEGCNMKGAQLAGARFDGAQLMGCNIDARSLSPDQARVVLTACEGCNFAHADLHGMSLRNVHIEGANLAYADLRNADLSGAMFTGVNFNHALLNGARVDDTDFTGCNFSGADLRNVDLSKASMTGSTLGDAIMR